MQIGIIRMAGISFELYALSSTRLHGIFDLNPFKSKTIMSDDAKRAFRCYKTICGSKIVDLAINVLVNTLKI